MNGARLARIQVAKLVRAIRRHGKTSWSGHARQRLVEHGMTMVDVDNVLRGGRVSREGEWVNETWRYRMETARMTVLFAFRSNDEIAIVTVWRRR